MDQGGTGILPGGDRLPVSRKWDAPVAQDACHTLPGQMRATMLMPDSDSFGFISKVPERHLRQQRGRTQETIAGVLFVSWFKQGRAGLASLLTDTLGEERQFVFCLFWAGNSRSLRKPRAVGQDRTAKLGSP
jgi:hypothetical protein